MHVLTRAQSREVDRRATEELGLPGLVLMENASRGVAGVILGLPPVREEVAPARTDVRAAPAGSGNGPPVAIVCGPGNNGGDGLAVARFLANAGVDPRIYVLVGENGYPEGSDAALHLGVARRMGRVEVAEGARQAHAERRAAGDAP